MKLRIVISILVLLALPAVYGAAAELYVGEVNLEPGTQPDAAAFRAALGAVLFKHTGDEVVARSLAATAPAPQQLMLGYQFREVTVPRFSADAAAERRLAVEFDPPSIDRLFTGQPGVRWNPERPDLLVWMVLEDETGLGFMPVDADWLNFAFRDAAARAGLFLEFPLHDAQDLLALDPRDVREASGRTLHAATRYGTAGVLLVDMTHTVGMHWNSRWRWMVGNRQATFELAGEHPEPMIAEALRRVAGQLAASYRTETGIAAAHEQVLISGLRNATHYAELLEFMQGLSMVRRVRVLSVREDRVLLGLDLSTGGLENAVSLGRLLEPAPPAEDEPQALHYRLRW